MPASESSKNPWESAQPEIQILLACCRTILDEKWASRIKGLVRQEISWDRTLFLAAGHGVAALLHRNLSLVCPNEVPPEVLKRLRDDAHRVASRSVVLATELLSIIDLLAANSISSMPYKGPALACQVYGDFRLRNFIDLDVLIQQSDLGKARSVLKDAGFKAKIEMTEAKERAILKSECDESFTSNKGKILLELHWAITPPFFSFPLKTEELFERATSIELLGKKVLAPAIEDLLLILCVNGTKDKWGRLEFVCRVAELVLRYPNLDWDITFARARELGAERMLLLGLFLTQHILETPLPEHVAQRTKESPILKRLAGEVWDSLFNRPEKPHGQFELALFRLRSREHLRDRVTYCFKRALAPTYQDLEGLSLPPSLEFLYPLVRPFRLIRR